MFSYIIKRTFIFIPTLLVICLFTFLLSTSAPGDPVLRMLNQRGESDLLGSNNSFSQKLYRDKRAALGLDLPLFYFSISSLAMPDMQGYLFLRQEIEIINRWSIETGDGKASLALFIKLKKLRQEVLDLKELKNDSIRFIIIDKLTVILNENSWINLHDKIIEVNSLINNIGSENIKPIILNNTIDVGAIFNRYIPTVLFNGLENQFNYWFLRLLNGDFGKSYIDKRPVLDKVLAALEWSLPLSISSIVLTFLLSIPIGIYSAVYRRKWFDTSVSAILFLMYSVPSFWLASMIMVFLGDPESPLYAAWFDPLGYKSMNMDSRFSEKIIVLIKHIWVPLFCLTYFNLAFVSRQMRSSMLEVLAQDYIRTAYAKGLYAKGVIWKHAFRNSLLPIITMLGGLFPIAIGGAIVLEVIFSIPGMGWLTLEAIYARDYPVIITIVFFSGVMTLIGYLFSDIMYAYFDPRIRFDDQKAVE